MKRSRLFSIAAVVSLIALLALAGWRLFGGHTVTTTYEVAGIRHGAERVVARRTEAVVDYGIVVGPLPIPLVLLVVPALILPAIWTLRVLVHWVDPETDEPEHAPKRLCPVCGYDLRATPDAGGPLLERCPECGQAAAAGKIG